MNDTSQIRFERTWTTAILVLVVGLTTYFVVTEWDGLVRFLGWLLAGIAALPASLSAIASYYAALPAAQLIPSLVIGALVGIVLTWRVLFAIPQAYMKHGGGMLGWVYIAIGGVLGLLSSQILTGTLRHCTYAPDIDGTQAIGGIVVTAISSIILLIPYMAWLSRPLAGHAPSGHFRRPALAFAFLAPTLISLLIFLYYPSVQSVLLSLTNRRFPLPQERFVCLANYVALANDVRYQSSALTTIFITAAIVLLSLGIALGVALLASQKIKGASLYRTLLIWPFALSPIVTGVIFLALFREGGSGLINSVLIRLTGTSPSWLRDPVLARWVIVMASVWNILGFNILFYVAGLQNVPKDLVEAAHIDGANRVQRFVRIVFPLLSPYTFFLLITNVTYSFYGIYGAVDALTQGGPPIGAAGELGGATNVLIYKLYQDAFSPGSPVGSAAAQALILFIVVALVTLLQFRFVESRVTYSD